MTSPAPECVGSWVEDCGCGFHAPCWPRPDTSCCESLTITPETPQEQADRIERVLHIAVEILWAMSGRKFGLCPVTVRPCRDSCQPASSVNWGGVLNPLLIEGRWYNGDPCGKCTTSCSCTELCEVTLPGPVNKILEVKIDGLVLGPGNYRVDNGRKLVATGEVCWPTCQDLSAPAGAEGTWTVTYLRGVPVPAAGRWAAGLLACQLMAACEPATAGECQLPGNLQRIAREGIELDLAPLTIGGRDGVVEFGRTGVPEVDLWLAAINPGRHRGRARVYSPDRPRPRTTTWPCND